MKLLTSLTEVNQELRGLFVGALIRNVCLNSAEDLNADEIRRYARPFLQSITMPLPSPHFPNDEKVKRWEAIAQQELKDFEQKHQERREKWGEHWESFI
jgi:hypothetical protein